jgi:hypothetical protein
VALRKPWSREVKTYHIASSDCTLALGFSTNFNLLIIHKICSKFQWHEATAIGMATLLPYDVDLNVELLVPQGDSSHDVAFVHVAARNKSDDRHGPASDECAQIDRFVASVAL